MPKMALGQVALCAAFLATLAACSKEPSHQKGNASVVAGGRKELPKITPAESNGGAAKADNAQASPNAQSAVIGMRNVDVGGKAVCKIDFVYAGQEPEDLFWDGEPCEKVTVRLVDRAELERLGKWDRLDEFERRFVSQMPGGKVLYVEGAFTASIYPVGTTGSSHEVSIAD